MAFGRPIQRKLGRAVAWEPTHDAYYLVAELLTSSRKLPPVYIDQAALRTVETRLLEGDVPFTFGLLAGNHYRCPRLRREYLLIDTVMAAHIEPTGRSMKAALTQELWALSAIAKKHGRLTIGWYLGGAQVLEPLTRDDMALHTAIFPEPWQIMLVRDGFESVRHGAFIRIEPTESRPYAIRFFELLPGSLSADDHALPTALHWANYRTGDTVERAASIDVAPPVRPPRESLFRRIGDRVARSDIERPIRQYRESIFRRLSDLRKRIITPRVPVKLFNGNSHDVPPEPQAMAEQSLGANGSEHATLDESREVSPVHEEHAPDVEYSAISAMPEVTGARMIREPSPSPAAPPTLTPEPAGLRLPMSSLSTGEAGVWIEVRPSTLRLPQLFTQQLDARLLNIRGRPVSDAQISYETSNPAVVSVSSTGLVTSHGPAGAAAIRVRSGEVQFVVQVQVVQVATRIEVTPSPTHVTARKRRRLTPHILDAVGAEMPRQSIVFSSSDPATVAVSEEGVLSTQRPLGEATITVRAAGTSLRADVPVTVVTPGP